MSNGRYISPRILQGMGVLLLVASAVYWGVTGHQSVLFVGAAMSMIGLGAWTGVSITLRNPNETPAQVKPQLPSQPPGGSS